MRIQIIVFFGQNTIWIRNLKYQLIISMIKYLPIYHFRRIFFLKIMLPENSFHNIPVKKYPILHFVAIIRRNVVQISQRCGNEAMEVYHKSRRGVPQISQKCTTDNSKNQISACDTWQRHPEEVSYKFRRSVLLKILERPDFTEFWMQYFIVIFRRSVVL